MNLCGTPRFLMITRLRHLRSNNQAISSRQS
jgi:hypothetical protein